MPLGIVGAKHRIAEFVRYVASGCIATIVNLTAVWAARQATDYAIAVAIGAICGTISTYLVTKLLVFDKASKAADLREIARFLAVHAVVCAQIWVVSIALERWFLPESVFGLSREVVASFIGVGSVVFTGYFLHRYITFRIGRSIHSHRHTHSN